MNSLMFKRRIEVIIGSKKWTYPELSIDFSVEFDTEPIPNVSECYLYNLSNNSIQYIKRGMGIVVNAGYGTDIGSVVTGVISSVETNRKGLDKETLIKIVNVPNDYLEKGISYTYGKNSRTKHIIKDVLDYAGGIKPNVLEPGRDIVYTRGFAAHGKIGHVLQRLCSESNSRLVIHNSSISIIPNVNRVTKGYLLKADTGLIEVEKIDKSDSVSTHKVRMLLNHSIAPYSFLDIRSAKLNGVVMVVAGQHNSSSFETVVEVRVL